MALYMYQASYTAKSMAAQIKEPQDPVEAFGPTLEELGANLVVAGFPFGEYDVLVVYEAPDDMTAASVAMAVAAAGEVRSGKTTRLLSGQEWLESLRKRRIVNARKADARLPRQSPAPGLACASQAAPLTGAGGPARPGGREHQPLASAMYACKSIWRPICTFCGADIHTRPTFGDFAA
jgi:uncharacterized protein with GYD domain